MSVGYRTRSHTVLPIDILADVVENLNDDHVALKACSLVSRSWVHPTRVHLFKQLGPKSTGDELCFSSFLSFLRGSPSLCPFLRWLVIAAPISRSSYSKPVRISLSEMEELLANLPMVHTVEFCGVSFAGCQYDDTPSRTFSLQCVRFIDVGSQGYDTALDWTRLLSLFSEVGELHFQTEIPHVYRIPPELPTSAVKVSRLKLNGVVRLGIMLDFLSVVLPLEALSSVDVTVIGPEQVATLGTLLSRPSLHGLRFLTLDFTRFRVEHFAHISFSTPMPSWNLLGTFPHSNLNTLALSLRLSDSPSIPLSEIPSILQHAPSCLKTISIKAIGTYKRIRQFDQEHSHSRCEMTGGMVETLTGMGRTDLGRIEEVVLERFTELETLEFDLTEAQHDGYMRLDTESLSEGERLRAYVEGCMSRMASLARTAFPTLVVHVSS
ncbi:hypothetical protein BXZ70DRAFT_662081 [Cristinia sonorae]|uniref:F-box domain-containing protein n=1 Tax=Cristinia sonorae TaxID=1940300 RepID=A0A8K0UDI6_9AGAR|nr:hypothetical protein BXZ70DRAFT_662081 [Cristinia sonorae]